MRKSPPMVGDRRLWGKRSEQKPGRYRTVVFPYLHCFERHPSCCPTAPTLRSGLLRSSVESQ